MKRTMCRLLFISLVVAPLAACGGDDDESPPPVVSTPPPTATPPPATGTQLENQFGTGFGTIFRAAAWSEPVDPKAGDVVPVSSDKDPVNF